MNYSLRILIVCVFMILMLAGLLAMNFSWSHKMDQEMPEEDKMLYGFLGETGRNLELKYGMSIVGVGGGAKEEKIWLMSLVFERRGDPLIEQEARKLIISSANDFLELINNDEQLRPFLKEYPFTIKNIDLSIHSGDWSGHSYANPFIVTVHVSRGKIGYFTIETPDSLPYKTKKYELFEEGVAILKGEEKSD